MENNVIYTALFVDDSELLKQKYPPVHKNEFYHHSTISFKPKEGEKGVNIGEKYSIKIIGRVKSDLIDALLVDNKKSLNKNPHITLSTAEGIKPFKSNEEIAKAIDANNVISIDDSVDVTEGYFNGNADICNK